MSSHNNHIIFFDNSQENKKKHTKIFKTITINNKWTSFVECLYYIKYLKMFKIIITQQNKLQTFTKRKLIKSSTDIIKNKTITH